jgi:hypothetical protein
MKWTTKIVHYSAIGGIIWLSGIIILTVFGISPGTLNLKGESIGQTIVRVLALLFLVCLTGVLFSGLFGNKADLSSKQLVLWTAFGVVFWILISVGFLLFPLPDRGTNRGIMPTIIMLVSGGISHLLVFRLLDRQRTLDQSQ